MRMPGTGPSRQCTRPVKTAPSLRCGESDAPPRFGALRVVEPPRSEVPIEVVAVEEYISRIAKLIGAVPPDAPPGAGPAAKSSSTAQALLTIQRPSLRRVFAPCWISTLVLVGVSFPASGLTLLGMKGLERSSCLGVGGAKSQITHATFIFGSYDLSRRRGYVARHLREPLT